MTSKELVQQGIAAYKAGRKQEARDLLTRAVDLDPDNEGAWLWLSGVVDTDEERLACLAEVLAINPDNATAQRGMDLLRAKGVRPAPVLEPAPPPPPSPPVLEQPDEEPAPPAQPLYLDDAEFEPSPRPLYPAEAELEPAEPELRPEMSSGPVPPEMSSGPVPPEKDRDDITPTTFWLAVAGLGLAFVCVLALLLYVLLGPGIQLPGARPTESPAAITAVLYEQVAAHNAEDIDRYMATMHSDTKGLDEMRSTLADLYATHDLDTRLYEVEVLKVTSREARVSFVLVTRQIRGPAFTDNRIEGVFILRKDDGRWKLYDQEIEDIEYLE
jgi:ketosteroid isomerase-like protein